jgi:hypothetical protein
MALMDNDRSHSIISLLAIFALNPYQSISTPVRRLLTLAATFRMDYTLRPFSQSIYLFLPESNMADRPIEAYDYSLKSTD